MPDEQKRLGQKAYLLLAAPVRKGFLMLLGGVSTWLLYGQSGDWTPAAITLSGFFTLAGLPEGWRMLSGVHRYFVAFSGTGLGAVLKIFFGIQYFLFLAVAIAFVSCLTAPFAFADSLIEYVKAARAARRATPFSQNESRAPAPDAAYPPAPSRGKRQGMPTPDLPPVVSGKDRPLGF